MGFFVKVDGTTTASSPSASAEVGGTLSGTEPLNLFVDEPADPSCVEVERVRVEDEGCFDVEVGGDKGDEVLEVVEAKDEVWEAEEEGGVGGMRVSTNGPEASVGSIALSGS
ncbi:hypothetical protein GYMLUDRAFT_251113 [Collybiopsis luxurians FD-317 M1]|uniref:Uncharacterized protein n=1 Tax=Collybiopsis luxurians FD-317 M1 TaxID=944289 RepID=A0A0D0BDL9_9AGAR|nr:hypothetical protein GYMLUDRAFT_251113 [Collybiopsis luxurians FD-317 M1]